MRAGGGERLGGLALSKAEGISLLATAVAEARVEVLDREARRRELLLGLGVERAVDLDREAVAVFLGVLLHELLINLYLMTTAVARRCFGKVGFGASKWAALAFFPVCVSLFLLSGVVNEKIKGNFEDENAKFRPLPPVPDTGC